LIFLDTTFLVDILRKDSAAISWLDDVEEQALYTSEINVFELYTGLFRISESSKTKQKKRTFELEQLLSRMEVLSFDRNSAIESAKVLSFLMSRGEPIGARDIMIAGAALSRGIKRLVTRNIREFQRVPHLNAESY
jgi:predicted nucleic acid-binding protein